MKEDRAFKGFVLMALAFMVHYFKRFAGEMYLEEGEKFFLNYMNWNYALHQIAVIVLVAAAVIYWVKAVKDALSKK